MVISSRTPEGDPNRCPVCGNGLKLEPSTPTRDAPCPHCGCLLWFPADPSAGPLLTSAGYAAYRHGGKIYRELERKLNMSFAELELSVRATNCLESEGITTVRGLVIRTDEELLEVRNFGESMLREVKSRLAERGLHLGMK